MNKFLITLLLYIFATNTLFAEETIYITNGEWPPYLGKDIKNGYGFISKIVTESYKNVGIKVVYGFFPWNRAYKYAEHNPKWHGSAGWVKDDDREKSFMYSDPIINMRYVFFHKKSYNFDWATLSDLKNEKIGITLGYSYGEMLNKAIKSKLFDFDEIPYDEKNLEKLLYNRITIFPLDENVGQSMIAKNFTKEQQKEFTYHDRPVSSQELYVIISRKIDNHQYLVDKFNEGFKILKRDGKYDKYLNDLRTNKFK